MFTPQKIEEYLAKNKTLWIGGATTPTSVDKRALMEIQPLEAKLTPEIYPYFFAWYTQAKMYSQEVQGWWPEFLVPEDFVEAKVANEPIVKV